MQVGGAFRGLDLAARQPAVIHAARGTDAVVHLLPQRCGPDHVGFIGLEVDGAPQPGLERVSMLETTSSGRTSA
jgi:hypothetical protein